MAALGGRPPGEESPGSTETRCRLTAGGGDPRESATENRPPARATGPARVKRRGKSSPRDRQRKRHGKPHPEQDQIGAARRATGSGVSASPPGSVARGVRQRTSQRNGHLPLHGGDRTRLTGRLTFYFPRLPTLVEVSDAGATRPFGDSCHPHRYTLRPLSHAPT